MNNKLIVSDKIVELYTDLDFCAMEIVYGEELFINNLLNRQSNIVMKNNKKIIIVSLEKNKIYPLELFSYNGSCDIKRAYLVGFNHERRDLRIVFTGSQEWHKLGKYDPADPDSDKKTWEYLNEDYEKMLHNGRNDNSLVTRKASVFDSTLNRMVKVNKRMFTESTNAYKRDSNLTKLSDFEESDLIDGKSYRNKQKKKKSRSKY